jgi:lysozyme
MDMRLIWILLLASLGWSACNWVPHDAKKFEIHGLDVSHHQKRINWDRVQEQPHIQFVFVKATEADDFKDSLFAHNWAALGRTRFKRGAYHFFRPQYPAYIQAQNFIETVKLGPGDLPPVLDIEVEGKVSTDTLLYRIGQWLYIVEKHYGVKPIIYSYKNMYLRLLQDNFPKHTLWLAHYTRSMPDYTKWAFWQYHDRGYVPGIITLVDENVFNGTMEQLDSLCLPTM